ncbi:MAG: MBL fold metallo-hydrolase [Gaiellaceae bacterium]|jgi:L-ascorbate metabolism protein UlaG (beta-lactamase superfamily)
MRIKLFPHSWLLIEVGQTRIHVDPSYVERFYEITESAHGSQSVDGLPEPMEKADLILITHGDFDHLNAETIERLRDERTQVLCPSTCANSLGDFARVLSEGDELVVGEVGIEVVPAYNTPEGRSTNKHHVRGESVGYVLSIGGRRVYHSGDTDLIPEMSELGDVDIAFLPIGGTYTMDVDEAVEAALLIEPELAVPMHTRGEVDPHQFVRELERQAVGIRALAPAVGEPIELLERVDGSEGSS